MVPKDLIECNWTPRGRAYFVTHDEFWLQKFSRIVRYWLLHDELKKFKRIHSAALLSRRTSQQKIAEVALHCDIGLIPGKVGTTLFSPMFFFHARCDVGMIETSPVILIVEIFPGCYPCLKNKVLLLYHTRGDNSTHKAQEKKSYPRRPVCIPT